MKEATAQNFDKEDSVFQENMEFWSEFYSRQNLRHEPSPFAVWCLDNHLRGVTRMLELGCGNGRDSFTFLSNNIEVLAIDGCELVVNDNKKYLEDLSKKAVGDFVAHDLGDVTTLPKNNKKWFGNESGVSAIYSRFFLHAVPEEIENSVLGFCFDQLPPGGLMMHEFRTSHDPLSNKGQHLSDTERWTDHYRRFINADNFRNKLIKQGWEEVYFKEDKGLAPFGEEDPIVARIVMRKPRA